MTDFEGVPEDEKLSIPDNLDPGTLKVVADLWNSTLAGAHADIVLERVGVSAERDFSKLSGKELDQAVAELASAEPVDPKVCRLGECAVFRAMQSFGRDLAKITEENQQ